MEKSRVSTTSVADQTARRFLYTLVCTTKIDSRLRRKKKTGEGSIFQQGNGRKPFRILLPHPHRGVVWQLQTNNKVCVASFVSINN